MKTLAEIAALIPHRRKLMPHPEVCLDDCPRCALDSFVAPNGEDHKKLDTLRALLRGIMEGNDSAVASYTACEALRLLEELTHSLLTRLAMWEADEERMQKQIEQLEKAVSATSPTRFVVRDRNHPLYGWLCKWDETDQGRVAVPLQYGLFASLNTFLKNAEEQERS